MVTATTPLRSHVARAALVLMLGLPAIAGVLRPPAVNAENRALTPFPALPLNWTEFLRTPAQLDAWANDHFGLRAALVRGMTRLRYRMFGEFPTTQVARGRNGRSFLASHSTALPRFSALTNVCGPGSEALPGTAEYFKRMFTEFQQMGLQPRLMIVPSAPPVYSADMPAWMEARCASPQTPVSKFLADPQLGEQVRQNTYYPLKEMRAIAASGASLYPKTWFHWSGAGLEQVAQISLQHFWPLAVTPPLRTRQDWLPSDISHLFLGQKLSSLVTRPDFAASGIQDCHGAECFPEFPGAAGKLRDVSRYRNPAAPARRLVLVSDSFGAMAAGWYARYYGTVEHVATNYMFTLSPVEVAQMKAHLFADPEHTDILFLFSDGGAIFNVLKAGIEPLHQGAPAVATVSR